ncbi:DUF6281 family protein [Streptomyces sp. NPDC059696]|uniref:DUF6281 family protein n=1 Tax=Streptomyces sp. NPDC059696 TaxID=3346911 RepID=UPI0036A95660
MSWAQRSVIALLTAAAAASVSACEPAEDSGEAAPSCVHVVTYEGRTYRDVANVEFRHGAGLGTATQPPCDDTGGRNEGEDRSTKETAYAVDGVSPDVAIAVGDAPDDVRFVAVHSGSELPPEPAPSVARTAVSVRAWGEAAERPREELPGRFRRSEGVPHPQPRRTAVDQRAQ